MKKQKRILIVEDEFPIALDIKRRLEKLGHHVLDIAPNFDKGLALFNKENPDIILLDINLNQDKDGIDLGIKIKSVWPKAIIIFITSYSNNEVFERAVNLVEPSGYLVKPIRDNELYRTIQMTLVGTEEIKTMPNYIGELSKREFEILKYVAMGLTDEEIGEKTFISINTVRTHLRRAYAKLLVKNKVEAVNFLNLHLSKNH